MVLDVCKFIFDPLFVSRPRVALAQEALLYRVQRKVSLSGMKHAQGRFAKMRSANLQDLQFLIAVSRHGSMLEAGRAMGLATTTVSRRIGALERELGAHLVHRSNAGTALTPIGHRLVSATASLATQLESRLKSVSASDKALEGVVKVTVVEGLASMALKVMQSFRELHPKVSFELDLSNRILNMSKNEADLALRTVRPKAEGLVCRPVGVSHLSVYGASVRFAQLPHDAPARKMARLSAVVLGGELSGLKESLWLRSQVQSVSLHVPTMAALIEAVGMGLGIGVIPDELARGNPSLHRLWECEAMPTRPIWLVMNRRTARTERIRAFADHLTEQLRTLLSPA
jgi:DNA-binding transcriptional LysR family regulator